MRMSSAISISAILYTQKIHVPMYQSFFSAENILYFRLVQFDLLAMNPLIKLLFMDLPPKNAQET